MSRKERELLHDLAVEALTYLDYQDGLGQPDGTADARLEKVAKDALRVACGCDVQCPPDPRGKG